MSDLSELYQEVILDHNKSPRNFRVLKDANRSAEGYNPLCGDQFTVYLKLEDGVIKEISFPGRWLCYFQGLCFHDDRELKGENGGRSEGSFRPGS